MITDTEPVASFKAPHATAHTQPFWDGLNRHMLLMQRCNDCNELSHPPGPVCKNCMSENLRWNELSGQGVVYTFTVTHRAMHPEFEPDLPFVIAYVKLDEGPMIVSWLRDVDTTEDLIGLRVRIAYECINDSVTLHRFVPAGETA